MNKVLHLVLKRKYFERISMELKLLNIETLQNIGKKRIDEKHYTYKVSTSLFKKSHQQCW